MSFKDEIRQGNRFGFGKNWLNFSKSIDEKKINDAINTLKYFYGVESLNGKNFIDVGSGSGIFSLASSIIGAKTLSFDYDENSVECTANLKEKYAIDKNWIIEQGSVLDSDYIESLGKFDYVYSWGVLHHTGNMNLAFDNVSKLVKDKGKLFIAIYNDQGIKSKIWRLIKKSYCSNVVLKMLIILIYSFFILIPQYIKYFLINKTLERGMNLYHDMFDWLGGYPFEVSSAENIIEIFKKKGFILEKSNFVGKRLGCNEFVFRKV